MILLLVVLIARWSMPGREAHEAAFMDYLEQSMTKEPAALSQLIKATSGVSLRNLAPEQRRSALNLAGFIYNDYFFLSTSECELANFSCVGAASVVRSQKKNAQLPAK